MKKSYLTLSLFLAGFIAVISYNQVNSEIPYPPAGNAGDPFTANTCARSGCHPSPSLTPAQGDLTFNIGTGTPTTPLTSSFQYTGGQLYNLAFIINKSANPTAYYGFQVVALDGSNNQAGSFAVTDNTHTKIATSPPTGTRQYMGHKGANTFKNWVWQWTAPATSTGPVTFYYAYNLMSWNGVGTPTNAEGEIYTGTVTIQPGATGIEDISEKLSSLNIFPNPVTSEFSISFDLKSNEQLSASIYSLDGKLSRELMNEKGQQGYFNRSFNVQDLPAGIYLVKLNAGSASVTKKIIKQ